MREKYEYCPKAHAAGVALTHVDGHLDMTNLLVAFLNCFAKTLNIKYVNGFPPPNDPP
jgi:hypothetical protein